MSQDARSNLLTLVRPQIDSTLVQVAEAAARHAATPVDNAALTTCVLSAHQVSGALRMVQFPGAARFGSEIEAALKAVLRSAPADPADIMIAGRAANTLREYVNDIAGGGNDVPLRLFPTYRELARVAGNASATEKDLFFPEAHDNAPAHASPRPITPTVLPALVKDLRSRFQRGLLAWLKESSKSDGPAQMRVVLDQLHQIAAQLPEPRGLWWAAVRLMDGVIELMPNPNAAEWIARVKPVCSRVDFLLRDLANNAKFDTAPAQRDVYYAVASCRFATPGLHEAQQVLRVEGLIPEAAAATGAAPSLRPLFDDARARLENIKDVWTEYVAGEPKRLTRFRELLAPLTQKAGELGNPALSRLLQAINDSTPQLPDPYPLDGQVMSLEMASALLMAENIVQHFHALPVDLEQQVALMQGWLADGVAGKLATSSPAGLRADIVQKANDEKLRIATAREILKSLQQVEKAVEAYASDPSKRDTLAPLNAPLRQVEGVFAVSNQKRAARLALACQHLLTRCAGGSTTESRRDIEWLAEGLGTLGFYLDPCLHGKEPNERAVNLYFTRYEKQQGFEALLGLSQQIAVVKTVPAPVAPPTVTVRTPLPVQPGVDREMLEVFLEEANEVLAAMETSVAQARTGAGHRDGDALINIRRGFHTLKGSSRMVGLGAYGDCAWELEQLMNHWLAQTQPATPELLDLVNDARTLLAEWAHALQGETTPDIDATAIAQRARALRDVAVDATAAETTSAIKAPVPTPPLAEIAAQLAPALPPAAAAPAPASVPAPVLSTATTQVERTKAALASVSLEEMETLLISTTALYHHNPPQAAPAVDAAAQTQRLSAAQPPSAATAEQTLADLGDRLTWLAGLVEEIQQAAKGSAHARLAELARTLSDSMGEALALQRRLRDTLADKRNPNP